MFEWFRKEKCFDALERIVGSSEEYVGFMRIGMNDADSDIAKEYALASSGNIWAKKVLDSFEGNSKGHFRRIYGETVKMEREVRRVLDKYR